MKEQLIKAGVDFVIWEVVENMKSWADACKRKHDCMLHTLLEFKRDVIFVDADCVFRKSEKLDRKGVWYTSRILKKNYFQLPSDFVHYIRYCNSAITALQWIIKSRSYVTENVASHSLMKGIVEILPMELEDSALRAFAKNTTSKGNFKKRPNRKAFRIHETYSFLHKLMPDFPLKCYIKDMEEALSKDQQNGSVSACYRPPWRDFLTLHGHKFDVDFRSGADGK